MKLSPNGFMIIAEFEGLRLNPYYATAEEQKKGIVTIGYGNTFYEDGAKVKITDAPITKTQALRLLQITTDKFSIKVAELLKKEVNQNQFDAMVSLAYNIGLGAFKTSSVLRLANQDPNDINIKKWFIAWNKQAGKVLQGLVNRREKEVELYFKK